METRSIQSYNNSFEQLLKDLSAYQQKEYKVIVASPSVTRAKRLAEDMRENNLVITYSKDVSGGVQRGRL